MPKAALATTDPKPVAVLIPEAVRRLDEIVEQAALAELPAGRMSKAITMARGIRMLQDALTPEVMKDIVALQGSCLGFRTDKDSSGGYPEKDVKRCLIEALLQGALPVGNQFNIIASRSYLTKEFFEATVPTLPGMSNLLYSFEVPKIVNGGALVGARARWLLNDKEMQLQRILSKDAAGTEIDERIPVRVNSGQGADAILGKATRKLLRMIYGQCTGVHLADGDADDQSQLRSAAPPMESVAPPAGELPGDEAVEFDDAGAIDKYGKLIAAATKAKEVDAIGAQIQLAVPKGTNAREVLGKQLTMRRGEIKA